MSNASAAARIPESAVPFPSINAAAAPAVAAPAAGVPAAGPVAGGEQRPLRQHVEAAVRRYFQQLDGQMASDVYDMVLQEMEAPLLKVVMQYTRDNQTLASSVLGLNRGTLRKKLKRYGML